MAKKDCKASGGAVIAKKRGGSLSFDAGHGKARAKSFIKKAGGGSVFSSAGGGSASTNPMGCTAGRK